VTTLPSAADVWVDGVYVGRSPVLVDALARGHHAVTLTKSGWVSREADVDVSAGATAMSSLRLDVAHKPGTHQSGSVTFHGLAPGIRVVIDGEPVARDPRGPVPLSAGMHVAVMTLEGEKVAHTFTVYPDTTTQIVVHSVAVDRTKSVVVAPAEEFLPDEAYRIEGKKVTVRYGGHFVVARIGELPVRFDGVTVSYDVAPSRIGGKLYLPLALLTRLTDAKAK
jgi:hypothetical protein